MSSDIEQAAVLQTQEEVLCKICTTFERQQLVYEKVSLMDAQRKADIGCICHKIIFAALEFLALELGIPALNQVVFRSLIFEDSGPGFNLEVWSATIPSKHKYLEIFTTSKSFDQG